MGRHQMASSSARARVALGALPLVAMVGAIGIGSAVMSPAGSEGPLDAPAGGAAGAGGTLALPASVPLAPGVPPAPVQVLDLAATGGSVTGVGQGVPGGTIGSVRPGGGGSADGTTVRRATRTAGGGETTDAGRAPTGRGADTAPRGGGGGGGATAGGAGSSGGAVGSGGGAGADEASGGSGSEGSGGSGGSGGGGLLGGVVGGLGSTVSRTTSVLSFGDSWPSLLSFGS